MSEKNATSAEKAGQETVAMQPILGRADHKLDPKRRFTVPSEWCARMGGPAQLYAMPSLSHLHGPARCLDLFCPAEFDRRMARFRDIALSDASKAGFASRIGELVSCVSLDTMNRIRVKDSLLAYAGIGSDVVLIGTGYHIEVWSLENRPKIDGREGALLDQLAAEAQSLGF